MFIHKPVSDWFKFLLNKGFTIRSTIVDSPEFNESLFYLEEQEQYIFICDELTMREIELLIYFANKQGKDVVIGYSDGEFSIIHDGWGSKKFELKPRNNSFLCKCDSCNNWWFGNIEGLYSCSACDVYSGGHLPSGTVTGDCKLW